ncbi:MAG: ABC transporter permease [Phycisphaerae bacterium]|nr:ABC transporter permease [Phycisphaerae bacterium]
MFLGIVVILIVLIALRHPYIARRLLIMVPTLLIISLVVFFIIQLPPGDFLTAKIMLLQQSGDEVNMEAIDDLREQFYFDDPQWKRYCRWMGVYWFTSYDKDGKFFSEKNEGLLQGNMGRSMETTKEVNEVVGDRILLTFLISLGTVIFTWAVAIPIGIYSAVRQYSVFDYVLTFVGFIGMCIPAFLLALILMAISGVSGLFSAEFAAQPEWDWPKVVDLLKHIWIPVIVLGVGGTAGMIRVMRANLLDELKKPYVTTARAKGVRPIKLLFKYPVRLALNPFISGIGGLFPQLVSGGAIVAMVLSLPTVGPLMLEALFSEDMYMAGSMLMVLSLLGVFGTLVSDLLLLWLDPRIRFKGGSR